jgi:hypothetical protein
MKRAIYGKTLTIALRPSVYETVKKITDEAGTSMADFIRNAVEKGLDLQEGKFHQEERSGINNEFTH